MTTFTDIATLREVLTCGVVHAADGCVFCQIRVLLDQAEHDATVLRAVRDALAAEQDRHNAVVERLSKIIGGEA